eukprot:TRINITY_DN18712_c0_g1_i1.p1 TRINITY_DN18712_c0_g1~~TRINITY_DN18712_c0_g1_i1.p1  ORF type:complete len:1369 (+),score=265.63 TRINITY_DN18712_c0_g1_i1:154-4260(+)
MAASAAVVGVGMPCASPSRPPGGASPPSSASLGSHQISLIPTTNRFGRPPSFSRSVCNNECGVSRIPPELLAPRCLMQSVLGTRQRWFTGGARRLQTITQDQAILQYKGQGRASMSGNSTSSKVCIDDVSKGRSLSARGWNTAQSRIERVAPRVGSYLQRCCMTSSHLRGGGLAARMLRRSSLNDESMPREVSVSATSSSSSGASQSGKDAVPEPPKATSVLSPPEETLQAPEDALLMEDRLALEEFLETKLPMHPKLVRGQLENGLRYVILPNKVPPNRFEAHLEMHVGSVDEEEYEQGVAHMIEHVTFLGSKKREKLLGTGARSNAYTDFHHTVFHVHAPVTIQGTNEPLLPLVLDALHEIAFKPKFVSTRIEKERRAVLSELQMMNTIEYRVDCQLLQHLHSENLLSCRFPIGLEEQIHKWDADTIKAFHERWYFPANATLFVVGDIGSVGRTVEMIEAQFGSAPPGVMYPPHPSALSPALTHLPTPFSPPPPPTRSPSPSRSPLPMPAQSSSSATPIHALPAPVRKERHPIRPPVEHQWSTAANLWSKGGVVPAPPTPHVFQHELLQNFSMSIFCKLPVKSVQRYGDLRTVLMQRIVLSTLQFRINARYKSANPPFTGIELDHSDSGREGCAVSTLTVTSEPRFWEGAVMVGVQEVRRLREFGVTRGELARYLSALLKDSEQLAAMVDNIPSVDNLDFIMESDALGHTVMDQLQGHESLAGVAQTVTLEDVNKTAALLLEYIADFGKPSAPVPAAIVACVPMTIHSESNEVEAFKITPARILEVISEGLRAPMVAEPEVEVPKTLLPWKVLQASKAKNVPKFVPLNSHTAHLKFHDEATGVMQRRLSNGIRINYKCTNNEAKGGVLRVVAAGGRARESPESGGEVAIGVRTLSEGGAVGGFTREQVELFCVSNLINCVLEADEEFMCMDFHFTMRDGGLQATFELIHLVLERSVWVEDALDRAKQLYLTHFRSLPKSLERSTAHRLMREMFASDQRFIEPSPDAIEKLTLPRVKDAVMRQLVTGNIEVSIVGDFSEDEVERCLLEYLGTITPGKGLKRKEMEALEPPVVITPNPDPRKRNLKVYLRDTDERACAYIAGAAPNRWGYTSDGRDLNTIMDPVPPSMTMEQAQSLCPPAVEVVKDDHKKLYWKRKRHPLYASVAMALLAEIVNARLFTTVRDALGLTYDVSFELSLFDRLKTGWFVISVTSTPAKIQQAVEASLNVLRGLHGNRVNQRELDRAKRTLLMRHESDLKDNSYWLGLITHLQSPSVKRKDVGCIRDLTYLYEVATADDVYNAYNYLSMDDESLFTCIGVAGVEAGNAVAIEAADGAEALETEQEEDADGVPRPALPLHKRGMSTTTRPTT